MPVRDVDRVVDLEGDRALGLLHQRGRIKGSDQRVEQALSFLVEVRDGKLARVDVFFSWDAGMSAAGLRE